MTYSLKFPIRILSAIVLVLVVTGGVILKFERFQLDLSTVEVWAAGLLFFCFLAFKKNKLDQSSAGPILRPFLDPHFTSQFALFFLIFICGLIFIAHCFKHWSLHTHGFDMSFVHQPLFYPYEGGHWLKTNASNAKSVLSEHLAFSYLLLAPLTMFFHSDEWIFFLQVLLIGISLWGFVTKGPLKKYSEIFLVLFLIILSHRGLRSGMLFDFREDVLAFVGLIGMALALIRGSIFWYIACFFLALLSKENIFAVNIFFIFPILFSKNVNFSKNTKYILAVTTVMVSLLYAFVAFKYLIPHFTILSPESHPLFVRFGYLGKTAPEIVWNILTSPPVWLKLFLTCFTLGKIKYLILILGPFAFFYRSRESWIWALIALPGILMNICHDYTTQIMLIFHYELIILPGLIAALLFGVEGMIKESQPSKAFTISPLFWGVLVALCFSGRWPGYFITSNIPTAAQWRVGRELHALQNDQNVAVDFRLSAQVNHLRDYTLIQYEKEDSQNPNDLLKKYAFVTTWVIDPENQIEKNFAESLKNNNFILIDRNFESDPVWIFVRK